MYKYAEIYGGKVRDLKESDLEYVEFCSIFDPTSFWVDVTGIDVEIGWLIKSDSQVGVHFEAPPPVVRTLETVRASKFDVLNELFAQASETAFIESSLGFLANAGQRAKSDVDGLIELLEETPEATENFMDYENNPQVVTLDDLKILRKEIILNGKHLYAKKWEFRNAITEANSIADLDAINISFNSLSFEEKVEETAPLSE